MQKARPHVPREVWIAGGLVTAAWLLIYLFTVSPTVTFIDSGELITGVHEPGVLHPPGYPLYTLLGYVVSNVLGGEVAWRVNALSAFFGALGVGAMFVFLVEVIGYTAWGPRGYEGARRGDRGAGTRSQAQKAQAQKAQASKQQRPAANRPGKAAPASKQSTTATSTITRTANPTLEVKLSPDAAAPATGGSALKLLPPTPVLILSAAAGASLLGAASTFWNRSTLAKMYTIHYFLALVILLLALEYRWSYERGDTRQSRRWLVALAAVLGISLTNHLMTTLVVPGMLVLLLWGRDWGSRLRDVRARWLSWVPALLLPLLLYLYLPIRAAQGPTMNWGSTDNIGDLYRHITGWQYGAYFLKDVVETFKRVLSFANDQWSWLTLPIWLLSITSGVLLARRNLPVFLATLTLAVLTPLFSIAYGISEIEPYVVPMYSMAIVWLGVAPSLIDAFLRGREVSSGDPVSKNQNRGRAEQARNAVPPVTAARAPLRSYALPAAALLAVVAIVSAVFQFPRQNHSNDHLAELFVQNAFNGFEKNSIVLTDHWDLYSPAYYMQLVKGVRPDVVLIDKSLLRYPWYLGQLEKRYPWLLAASKDLVDPFRVEQRKWVNGESFNQPLLQKLYIDLLTSFVDRNYSQHPAYEFFPSNCGLADQPQTYENNLIAPKYFKQPAGMAVRLWSDQASGAALPPVPTIDLKGYTYDKTPLDEFAVFNSHFYDCAFRATAQAYATAKRTDQAAPLALQAEQLNTALQGR